MKMLLLPLVVLLFTIRAFGQVPASSPSKPLTQEEALAQIRERVKASREGKSGVGIAIPNISINESELASYPEVKAAHDAALLFISEAFNRNFPNAERMMPTDHKPQKTGIGEYRQQRVARIKRDVDSKEKFGLLRDRATTMFGLPRQLEERPPGEVYFDFTFRATYVDGTFSIQSVKVMKRNGIFWIASYSF